MSKETTLFREVIFIHHPLFKKNKKMRDIATKNPEIFKVERLVEQAMAEVGGYEFVDADKYDFSDYTECKTASIARSLVSRDSLTSYKGMITNVARDNRLKIWDLRVVVYNPHFESTQYYYIPKKDWTPKVRGSQKSKYIDFCYNLERLTCNWLDKFEVESFETLAKIVASKYITQ
jgi:hypothetical protein